MSITSQARRVRKLCPRCGQHPKPDNIYCPQCQQWFRSRYAARSRRQRQQQKEA